MQLNPFFKCQGLEVRRGRSKFLLLCFEYSEVVYEMKYLRFPEWLVGGRVSIMLSRKTRVHKGKVCSTKMLHISSILFLGKKRYHASSLECTYNLILY